jgi:hypothetical protein
MTVGKASAGVDLDAIFDLYVEGTPVGATGETYGPIGSASDIGYRYAPLIYGTMAAPTHIYVMRGGVPTDLNQLFAAKGTASYALSINGQTFAQAVRIGSGSGSATIQFNVTTSGWQVVGSGFGGVLTPAAGTQASGANPAGAVTAQLNGTLVPGFNAGTYATNAASPLAISSNPGLSVTASGGVTPGKNCHYTTVINFFNSSGTNISSTTILLVASEGG